MRRLLALVLLPLVPAAFAQPVAQQGVAVIVTPAQFVYAGEADAGDALAFSDVLYGLRYSGRGLTIEAVYGTPTAKGPVVPLMGVDPLAQPRLPPKLTAFDVRAYTEQALPLAGNVFVPVRLGILVRRVRVQEDEGDGKPEFSADALSLGGGLGWADRRERTRVWAMGQVGLASRDFGSTGLAYGVEAGVRLALPIRDQALSAGYTFRLDGHDFGRLPLAGRETSDAADYYGLQHALSLGLRF